MINIAIDGYCGSGKSTLAKALANDLGFKILDTGAIFRALGYCYNQNGLGEMTEKSVEEFLKNAEVSVEFLGTEQHTHVNGVDVTNHLREEKVGLLASKISAFPKTREKYLLIAKKFANSYDCIMEGRDIGTVVMPNADVKLFLTADEKVRAKRRLAQLKENGETTTFEKVLKDLQVRDANDCNKGEASLRVTEESVIVDTTDMTEQEEIDYCLQIIKDKINVQKKINITIDGYVCSGKSTIAKALAKKLGFKVFDTGAVYRGIACAFDYMKLDENKISQEYVCKFARQININVEFIENVEHVIVNGIDHTANLRTERTSTLSAKLSPFVCLREKVLNLQRDFAKKNNLVMEGRDIGSFVLPNADFKFFCTADETVRAKRRFEQQRLLGNDVSFEEILKELQQRDYADVHRDHGALMILPESIVIDTTNQGLDESVNFCLKKIQEKCPNLFKNVIY
ncbi:MAG: (d)CMP kinase [Candidatus Caccovivens sp.]